MTVCDYCGHNVHPPDENGHDDHTVCVITAMIDENWHNGSDDHFLADPAGGGQWVKAVE
jgi:hypothetical protein